VLTVHDELVAEVPERNLAPTRVYEEIMEDLASCFAGYPIFAEAWAGRRYRKQ